MEINKDSHLPLYRQVEQVLEYKISSGQWDEGFQLPTEQELATLFNISTITVKRAIIELVNKGFLMRQRGKGTFVLGKRKEQDINQLISLTTDQSESHPHELLHFAIEIASSEMVEKMKLNHGDQVVRIERLKIVDGEPISLEYTYLPYVHCHGITSEDINNDLIYNMLRHKFHINLGKAKLFIKPYIATGKQAEVLGISENTAVFEWERFTYSKEKEIVEYSMFYVRPDKETYFTEVDFN